MLVIGEIEFFGKFWFLLEASMSRLTLRLPDNLHPQLEVLVAQEAVSLNQHILYTLKRQATVVYAVQQLPGKIVREQHTA